MVNCRCQIFDIASVIEIDGVELSINLLNFYEI